MTSKYTDVRSEADFPSALPPYGVWWTDQNKFTTHKSLQAVKNLLSASATNNQLVNPAWYRSVTPGPVVFTQNVKVYELHGTTWHLLYEFKAKAERDTQDLWKSKAPTTKQTVTEDEVESAIASILFGNKG